MIPIPPTLRRFTRAPMFTSIALIGVVVGVGAAAGLTRLMTSMLFRVSPLDLLTYAAMSAVLLTAAVLASYLPARRASSLNPVEALRAE